jgi:hypothetical protein
MAVTHVPVICASQSSVISAGIFNPNSWENPESKGIVVSCGAEFSALHHCVGQLNEMCQQSEEICRESIDTVVANWRRAPFDVSRLDYFVEHPDYHVHVEAFFSSVKSLLDLIVQLLQSERIVVASVRGFHREGGVYGGRVLKVLRNNSWKERRGVAVRIADFLGEQKALWIDKLIGQRDGLLHPEKGMTQVMFQFDLVENDGQLTWHVRESPMASYAPATLLRAQKFCETFIALVQGMPTVEGF